VFFGYIVPKYDIKAGGSTTMSYQKTYKDFEDFARDELNSSYQWEGQIDELAQDFYMDDIKAGIKKGRRDIEEDDDEY